MSKSIITIVICTFNAEKYLDGCLSAIKEQKDGGVQLVVIDGASTDRTIEIIQRNSTLIDYWVSEKDQGVYDAMNKAVALVKSGWILFLGADDRLMPNAIRKIKIQLESIKHEDTLLYGNVYRPSINRLYDGLFSKSKLMRRNICQQGILYPRSAFEKYHFNINFPINADHVINIELFFDNSFHKSYFDTCIAYYEDESDGISRNRADKYLLSHRKYLALSNKYYYLYVFASLIDVKEWLRWTLRKLKNSIFLVGLK